MLQGYASDSIEQQCNKFISTQISTKLESKLVRLIEGKFVENQVLTYLKEEWIHLEWQVKTYIYHTKIS